MIKNVSSNNEIQVSDYFDKKIDKRSIIKYLNYTWKMPIRYHISRDLSQWYVTTALIHIQQETCVRFKKENMKIKSGNGINFVYHKHYCGSQIGMNPNNQPQELLLNYQCMYDLIRIQTTVFRALGMIHEQCRTDRDSFVTIHNKSITSGFESNFQMDIYGYSETYNISYDYGSIMQSFSTAFSKDGKPTITSKISSKYEEMMGQRATIAFSDYKLINLHYCKNNCSNTIVCQNDGYQDPNSCRKCKCIHNFEGIKCDYPKVTVYRCGMYTRIATPKIQLLNPWGSTDCYYKIKSSEDKRVGINIAYVNAHYEKLCHDKYGVEVKHRKDKAVMGLCLCGIHYGPNYLLSEDNTVLVHHIGWRLWHQIKVNYVEVERNATIDDLKKIFKA
uniref:Metalloendopeptidase n=1 Tax=Parastrongyloides trichosuri TaxID=131310 RepID=A0A0N4Z8E7_PARTI